MDIYHTESFGPTKSVIAYKTEEEALGIANDANHGLSEVVFPEDLGRVARKYGSGAVHNNFMTMQCMTKSGYWRFNSGLLETAGPLMLIFLNAPVTT